MRSSSVERYVKVTLKKTTHIVVGRFDNSLLTSTDACVFDLYLFS